MLSLSVALSAFLVAQSGPLEVTNVRPTVGPLGPPVSKAVREQGRLPGDQAWFAFEVKNAKTDAKGKAKIGLSYEVTDSDGQPIFKEGPVVGELFDFLGSGSFPGTMNLDVPLDSKPGIYNVKLTITDLEAKKDAVFEAKGKVREPEFGIVRVGVYGDPLGRVPSPAVGVVGQNLFIRFAAIHFGKAEKKSHVEATLKVLDSEGKNVLVYGQTRKLSGGIVPDSPYAPGDFGLTLNRVGEFTVEIHAEDKVANKTTKTSFPLRVVAP
ncbi:MAG: hypothetical protein U0744_12380 [Gemmataceae bacterium]